MTEATAPWWARGLLFENCSCQLVCPGHIHFDNLCTYDRCIGYWALRIDDGRFSDVALGGAKAVLVYDCPKHMIEGNWSQRILIDADDRQAAALETILTGGAGGPWKILARFVSDRLQTRRVAIAIEDEEMTKQVAIEGLLQATVQSIKGRDRSTPVSFHNMFNQIHPPTQFLGRGTTRYDDGHLSVSNDGSHGLWSSFHWEVSE